MLNLVSQVSMTVVRRNIATANCFDHQLVDKACRQRSAARGLRCIPGGANMYRAVISSSEARGCAAQCGRAPPTKEENMGQSDSPRSGANGSGRSRCIALVGPYLSGK